MLYKHRELRRIIDCGIKRVLVQDSDRPPASSVVHSFSRICFISGASLTDMPPYFAFLM